MATRWTSYECPDTVSGKTILITGGTSGIGFHAAKQYVTKGAHVIIAGRNEDLGKESELELNKVAGRARSQGDATYIRLDLASFKNIKAFSDHFHSQYKHLHILHNNASEWIRTEPSFTEDGFQTMIGIQHWGHAYLTLLLLDLLKASAPARIVYTSSASEASGDSSLENIEASEEQGANSDFKAYGTGKIYNQLFVRELQRRLEGTGVDVYTCQPGMSQTRLFEKGAHWKWSVVLQDWMQYLNGLPPQMGCMSMVYAATAEGIRDGRGSNKTYGPYYFRFPWIFPWITNINPIGVQNPVHPDAKNDEKARELFNKTVDVIIKKTQGASLIIPAPPSTNGKK